MGLGINSNIFSLIAQKNYSYVQKLQSSSLERLSSGLRINKAADDGSGMYIANQLQCQIRGLGQAVCNANDAISIAQIADGAIDESIKIVEMVKTKSIQASQDGHTLESRKIIQHDINKLLQEFDNITMSTSFNGQKVLSGNFINKHFQIGAYSNQTVDITIESVESTKMGHTYTQYITPDKSGTLSLWFKSKDKPVQLSSLLSYDNSYSNSLGYMAEKINRLNETLYTKAVAEVELTSFIKNGETEDNFSINGIRIGKIIVEVNDNDNSLIKAINKKVIEHGIYGHINSNGSVTLTSTDGRAIFIENPGNVFEEHNLSTVGKLKIISRGNGVVLNINEEVSPDTPSPDTPSPDTPSPEIPSTNEAPFINISYNNLSYIEGSGEINIDANIELKDDNDSISKVVVKIEDNYDPSEDELSFDNTANIKSYWDKTSGTLTLVGIDTVSHYQSALRAVYYTTRCSSF